jgi:hypothetical protein
MKKGIAVLVLCVFVFPVAVCAQDGGIGGKVAVYGSLGVSGASGAYARENNAFVDFGYNPGLRLQLSNLPIEGLRSIIEFGYLESAFNGYVTATDSTFYNVYSYLNFNAMVGAGVDFLYYAGGLYYGIDLDAWSYRQYTDEWLNLSSNPDFGVVGEVGVEYFDLISVGIQARHGLKSIGSSVDIKNWDLWATIVLNFLEF